MVHLWFRWLCPYFLWLSVVRGPALVQLWFSCVWHDFHGFSFGELVGWFEVCWFCFGSTLVQMLVAWCFLVQHCFIFGSIVPGQVCSGSAWAQLWLSCVPACCGVIYIVRRWFIIWSVGCGLTLYSSVGCQLGLASCSRVQRWFSYG